MYSTNNGRQRLASPGIFPGVLFGSELRERRHEGLGAAGSLSSMQRIAAAAMQQPRARRAQRRARCTALNLKFKKSTSGVRIRADNL
jgi:hypothetical protein